MLLQVAFILIMERKLKKIAGVLLLNTIYIARKVNLKKGNIYYIYYIPFLNIRIHFP